MKLVTLKQAKKLKELGCDKDCLYYYDGEQIEQSFFIDNECKVSVDDLLFDFNNDYWWGYPKYSISAPTISEALDWFREVKGIHCSVMLGSYFDGSVRYVGQYLIDVYTDYVEKQTQLYYDTYSEAESALLDALIEYEINKNK